MSEEEENERLNASECRLPLAAVRAGLRARIGGYLARCIRASVDEAPAKFASVAIRDEMRALLSMSDLPEVVVNEIERMVRMRQEAARFSSCMSLVLQSVSVVGSGKR